MILFSWHRLTPPAFIGGAEITEGLWAALLAAKGHEVVFIGSPENPRNPNISSLKWLRVMLGEHKIKADFFGDEIRYTWRGVHCICVPQAKIEPLVRHYLKKNPHLVWTSQERCNAIAALARNVPIATYIHSVSEVGLLSAKIRAEFRFSPSLFVQRYVSEIIGADSILARPFIEQDATVSRKQERENQVLYINPISEKGIDLAVEVAMALSPLRFVFVEGWRPCELRKSALPSNITVLPRLPSLDNLYAKSKLLIVPSVVADAAPRVVSEAGLYGLPVIGTPTGGIPELVANPSANCITSHNLDSWIMRISELIENDAAWHMASDAQISHTNRLVPNPNMLLESTGLSNFLK